MFYALLIGLLLIFIFLYGKTRIQLTNALHRIEAGRTVLTRLAGPDPNPDKLLETAECHSRDLYFAHILGGGFFQDESALICQGKSLDVQFPHPYFVVLVARLETWGTLFQQGEIDDRDIYFILRNVLQNRFPGVTSAAEVKGDVVAILNLPEPSGMEAIVQEARAAQEVLEQEFGLEITVAISRIYHSPMDLPQGMHDAELVLDYLSLLGDDSPVTAYEQLTPTYLTPSATSYIDLETRLLGFARAKDFGGMRQTIHELISNEFHATKPTVDIFRFRVYGVVNTLLYLIEDFRIVWGAEILDELDPGPRLTSAKTLVELVDTIDDILDHLECYGKTRRATGYTWVQDMHQYVLDHYTDPDLTIAYISDHFHMSPTYCSKIFKDHYGIRLFDFIQQQRLQKAHALFHTEMTLSEIAAAAGFSSPLTMSRTFKRYEGATPSLLREQEAAE